MLRDENGYRAVDTEWQRMTNGLGKAVAGHCEKGMKRLIHARIHCTKWTDAAGVDSYGCEIIAGKVNFRSRSKPTETESPGLIDRDDEIAFYGAGLQFSLGECCLCKRAIGHHGGHEPKAHMPLPQKRKTRRHHPPDKGACPRHAAGQRGFRDRDLR